MLGVCGRPYMDCGCAGERKLWRDAGRALGSMGRSSKKLSFLVGGVLTAAAVDGETKPAEGGGGGPMDSLDKLEPLGGRPWGGADAGSIDLGSCCRLWRLRGILTTSIGRSYGEL